MTLLFQRRGFLTLRAMKEKQSTLRCLSAHLDAPSSPSASHPWGMSWRYLGCKAKENQLQTPVRQWKWASPAAWEHEGLALRRSSRKEVTAKVNLLAAPCWGGCMGEEAGVLRDCRAGSSAGGGPRVFGDEFEDDKFKEKQCREQSCEHFQGS